MVAQIVAAFHRFGDKPTPSIAVVTFYSRQVEVIESLLRAKKRHGAVSWVKTAESAQGLEQDIIIVSLVRSNPFGTFRLSSIKCCHDSRQARLNSGGRLHYADAERFAGHLESFLSNVRAE